MDTIFFWSSKLFWLVFSPGNLLVWLVFGSWILSLSRWQKLGHRMLTGTAMLTLLLAFLPAGSWLMYPLEQRFAAVSATALEPDGVVLLGGSFALRISENRQQVHLNGTSERLMAFLELANRYPDARLVFTGGSGNPTYQEAREADLARELFSNLGLQAERVVFERESRNTYENARNTTARIEHGLDETWLLVTSAFHMPRSFGVFCQQGWKLSPYPVDYRTLQGELLSVNLDFLGNLTSFNLAIREWIGLLAYRLTGKTNRLVPGPGDDCS
jgi:uncharacterized SAM-binding protein YcdF (DUF218 family)